MVSVFIIHISGDTEDSDAQSEDKPATQLELPHQEEFKYNSPSIKATHHSATKGGFVTQTPSTWQQCGAEGWQVNTTNLHELKPVILAEQPSLIIYQVNLQFPNTSTHEQFHWVLDKKGQWIHGSINCPESWLAIWLGMFQQGVYRYNIDLMINHSFTLYEQDTILNITETCLHDISTQIWPKEDKDISFHLTHTFATQCDYDLRISTFARNTRLLFFIISLLPYMFVHFFSRPIPKLCLQNGHQMRLHMSINQLPIGLKYRLFFWIPTFHPVRATCVFISLMIFPNLLSLFHKNFIVFYLPMLLSFGTLLCIHMYAKINPFHVKIDSLHTTTNNADGQYTSITGPFPRTDPNAYAPFWLQKYVSLMILRYNQQVEHNEEYPTFQTFQNRSENWLKYQNEVLKFFTNPYNWVLSHKSHIKTVINTTVMICVTICRSFLWLSHSYMIWAFDLILNTLDYAPKALHFVSFAMTLPLILLSNTPISFFSKAPHSVFSDVPFYYLDISVTAIVFLLWYPMSRSQSSFIRQLPVTLCITQLIIAMARVICDYLFMCFSLIIGLLIDPDVAGPSCFLLVYYFGIDSKSVN